MVNIRPPLIDNPRVIHTLFAVTTYVTGIYAVTRHMFEERKVPISDRTIEFWSGVLKSFAKILRQEEPDIVRYLPTILIERGMPLGEAIIVDLESTADALLEAVGKPPVEKYNKIISALEIFLSTIQEGMVYQYISM